MAADTAEGRSTVWLLRHAEAGEGSDPSLSAAGRARADAWHGVLGAPALRRVYATDTRRSRETAAAIAADAGAEVELYDPGEPGALIRQVVERNEPAVVVAHSNTLNPLAEALGAGPDLEEIGHDEHGRVYRVDLPSPACGVRRCACEPLARASPNALAPSRGPGRGARCPKGG